MPSDYNKNPVVHGNFRLEIDGIQVASFKECSEREFAKTVARTRAGDDPPYSQTYEGRPTFPDVTLKKQLREGAAADNKELYDWHKLGSAGKRTVSIIDLDFQGNEVRRTNHYGAWCPNFKMGSHDSTNESDPIIDEMMISYDYGEWA